MKNKGRRSEPAGKPVQQLKTSSRGGAITPPARKGSSWLTLTIMGGAGAALLHSWHYGCGEKEILFTNTSECVQAGYAVRVCEAQQQTAQQQLDTSSQAFDNTYDCQNHYGIGNCHYSLARHQFLPLLAGFSMAKRRQEDNANSSRCRYYGGGRAFYRDRDKPGLLKTPGSDARWTLSADDAHSIRGRTVSRGGFGGGKFSSGG